MPDSDLQDLAQRRAEAIIKEIKTTAGFDVTRVTAGSPGPVDEGSMEIVNTKLTLDVMKPAT